MTSGQIQVPQISGKTNRMSRGQIQVRQIAGKTNRMSRAEVRMQMHHIVGQTYPRTRISKMPRRSTIRNLRKQALNGTTGKMEAMIAVPAN